MTLIFSCRGPG